MGPTTTNPDYKELYKQKSKQAAMLQEQNKKLIEDMKFRIEMYKECFEKYIPIDMRDDATLFLSIYRSGLAKDIAKKEGFKI
jgi:hypothetical protein